MPKVVVNDQGLVQQTGSGFEFQVSPIVPVTPLLSSSTAPLTLSAGGTYTVTGSAASGNNITQIVMPLASSVPGAVFVIRSLSPDAHFLTGSQEVNGTKVFAGHIGTTPDTQGSKLTLATNGTVSGCSVALISDGKSFLVMAASGSCTISGT